MKGDYSTGQEVFYHEGRETLRVRVLKSQGTKKKEAYRLEILEVVEENPQINDPKVGEIFNCDKIRSAGVPGLWRLTDEDF